MIYIYAEIGRKLPYVLLYVDVDQDTETTESDKDKIQIKGRIINYKTKYLFLLLPNNALKMLQIYHKMTLDTQ